MTKDSKSLLSTRELCDKLRIHRHTLERMVKNGLPIAGRQATRGRSSWMFDPDAVAVWAAGHGRDVPAILGAEIQQAVAQDTPAQVETPPAADNASEPVALQLQAERSQYQKLFARFLRTHAGEDAAGVAALSKAITLKSDSLRRLELSAIEIQRQNGELVSLAMAQRLFVDLASSARERMMALPNELAPVLRDYLANADDIGKVHDEMKEAITHALMTLPEDLPQLQKGDA